MKPNLREAIDQFLLDSHLLQIQEGKRPVSSWPAAAAHDEKVFNALIGLFVGDLGRFLDGRQRYLGVSEPFRLSVTWDTKYDDVRATLLWQDLRDGVWKYANKLVDMIQPLHKDTRGWRHGPVLPMSSFKKNGELVEFVWADAADRVVRRRMVKADCVPAADYAQPLSSTGREMLSLADKGSFRHDPAILTGVVVEEDGTKLLNATGAGVVIRTGLGEDILVEYWRDDRLPSPWSSRGSHFFTAFACTKMAAVLLFLFMVLPPGDQGVLCGVKFVNWALILIFGVAALVNFFYPLCVSSKTQTLPKLPDASPF